MLSLSSLLAPSDEPSDEERAAFLSGLEEDFDRLAADAEALADYHREATALEGTLSDGLEDYPYEG